MHHLSLAVDIILAGYIAWQVFRFNGRYRQLKQDLANGDAQARIRVYWQALAFEWISALLAVVALGFDWGHLNPRSLALDNSALMQSLSANGAFDRGALTGVLVGIVGGTVGFAVARIRANRRNASAPARQPSRWRKLLPDFSALLPVSTQERVLWCAVAISAGICEEVVFRGWLLATLHSPVGLAGTALIVVAAAIFGLAHAYQRITGMILTTLAGVLFCVLYVKTGSLLVPILLHILIDIRFAILPAPRVQKTQASFA
jgi:membrane protease YdiL (CAAX protease family)